jgi:hypothetical protein
MKEIKATRFGKGCIDTIGEAWDVEEIHKQAGFSILNEFGDRRGPLVDPHTSSRHHLEHRPGHKVGVGKINMGSREL